MINRQLIGLGVTALTVLAAWLIIWPQWTHVQVSQTKLTDVRTLLEDKRAFVAHLADLTGQYQANLAQAERASLVLPVGRDVPGVLETVSALAVTSGVSLRKVGLSEGQGSSQTGGAVALPMVSISVEVSGSYEALKTLLGNIEQNIRLLEPANISFASDPSGGPGSQIFSLTLQLNAHYQ